MNLATPFVLALVGCTLVYPPFNAKTYKLDDKLPVNTWCVVASFDNCAECEKQRLPTLDS